jgi:flagellar FliL protein
VEQTSCDDRGRNRVELMSETKVEEPQAKKKSKLPVIIALVAILGGGGFFMMKGKGGGKKEVPAIKLGAIEPIEPEFIVNLSNGTTYLRAQVALQFQDGFKKEELEKNMAAVQDAISTILSGKSPSSIRTVEGKRKLKADIAAKINKLLEEQSHEEKPKEGKDSKEEKKEGKAKPENDWDSQTGPCLKVFFPSFAMQ